MPQPFDINQFLQMLGQAPSVGQMGGGPVQVPGTPPPAGQPTLGIASDPRSPVNHPYSADPSMTSPVTGVNADGSLRIQQGSPATMTGMYSNPSFMQRFMQGLKGQMGGAGMQPQQGPGQAQGQGGNANNPLLQILSGALKGGLGGAGGGMQK